MDHAHNVIQLLGVDRQAGVAVVADHLDRLGQRDIRAHGNDVGARHHDVVGHGFPQAQYVGDQRPFVSVEAGLFIRVLAGRGFLHQVGDRIAD